MALVSETTSAADLDVTTLCADAYDNVSKADIDMRAAVNRAAALVLESRKADYSTANENVLEASYAVKEAALVLANHKADYNAARAALRVAEFNRETGYSAAPRVAAFNRAAKAAAHALAGREADYDSARAALHAAAFDDATDNEAHYNSARDAVRDAAIAVIAAYDSVRSAVLKL